MDKILIIDMSHLYVKYFFVARYQYEDKGTEVVHKRHIQGLTRFFSLLEKNNKEFKKIFIVLDGKLSETDNKELFENYKEGRTKIEGIHKNEDKFISLISTIPRLTIIRNNKREADDIIAYLAIKYSNNNEVIVYSGDKDFLQLTSVDNISVSEKYEKGKFLLLSDEEIFSKFKNSKKEPFTRISSNKADIIKYRVFKGDSSDKIPPAIPRLTDKDIIYIIQNCWSEDRLDKGVFYNVVDKINKPALKTKFIDNRDNIFRNYQLMNLMDKINDDVIINETKVVKLKKDMSNSIDKIVKEFEIEDLWDKIINGN